MAFSPEIKVSICCNELYVSDVTEVYDGVDNPEGWNAPEGATTALVNKVVLKLEGENDTIEYNLTDQFYDKKSTPSLIEYNPINPKDFEDGFYTVILTYFFDNSGLGYELDSSYSANAEVLNISNSNCCLEKLLLKYRIQDPCTDPIFNEFVYLDSLIYALSTGASCLKREEVKSILKRVDRFCKFNDCGC